MQIINILVAGPAGSGIEAVSHSLALSFTREGLFAHTTSEYENLIRGGHNFSYVQISNQPIFSHNNTFDIIIALDQRSVNDHKHQLNPQGVIIYDSSHHKIETIEINDNLKLIGIPLQELAELAGLKLTANTVAVGAVFALMERDLTTFKTVLHTIFKAKGEEIIQINYRALELGYQFLQTNTNYRLSFKAIGDRQIRSLINGNEAICVGAIKAGIKFMAAYPMTPGSSIMTTLAKEAYKYNIIVSHVEDEIAAINMIIGASYAGVRVATSTSGGGFALMIEAIGMSAMTEIPVVIFNAQRPGPSTGLPTKTGQGDLNMAINCGQGDFPRLVIAPGDHTDCINLTAQAFNYADKFQLPVIFLTDKYLADSYYSCCQNSTDDIKIDRGEIIDVINASDQCARFAMNPNGVSARIFPGTAGGEHTVTSYEHNIYGQAVESEEEVTNMMEKRARKMVSLEQLLPDPVVIKSGHDNNIFLFIWGSTKGACLQAQSLLLIQNISTTIIQMQYLFPFKKQAVQKLLANKKILICIEENQSGQMENLLMAETGIKADYAIRSYTGRPITGTFLANKILEILN